MVAERGGLVAEPAETGNGACASLRYEWVLFFLVVRMCRG